jgi:hypothetical protein
MGISTQRSKDAADVGTLQSIGNLHAEESKAKIPHLAKREVWFLHIEKIVC